MTVERRPGILVLVGGDEFHPGNEPQDEQLVAAAAALGRDRPAFVIATAAARHDPDAAVATARRWFGTFGLQVEELRVRTRTEASSSTTAARAATGSLFYLCGGDPGVVPKVLAGTATWEAILEAWRGGAALAGSSAGAMALGEWTLIRGRVPGDAVRHPRPALAVVPHVAVLPHFDTFGHRWIPSASAALAAEHAMLLGIDERSAALWQDGTWTALGAGGVTVIQGGAIQRTEPGERILGLPEPA